VPSPLPQTVQEAMHVLNLQEPFSQEDLTSRYQEASRLWYPSRYAGLTNNPGKYMQMYKKGESKTKEIQAAFEILQQYLHSKVQE
jgi:DnaJ-class molecular chaperone